MSIKNHRGGFGTYYVHGSGLIPVPYHAMNEVSRLKVEFHEAEARQAMRFAWARKLA